MKTNIYLFIFNKKIYAFVFFGRGNLTPKKLPSIAPTPKGIAASGITNSIELE